MLAALWNKSIIAPFVFEGRCNAILFEAYVTNFLIKSKNVTNK